MRILSVGSFQKLSNTCLHRHWSLEKLAQQVDRIELYSSKISLRFKIANRLFQKYRLPVSLPDENQANKSIRALIDSNSYDLVWIDKGLTINQETLRYIKRKQPQAKLVSYTADNMVERHNQSHNFLDSISLYDYHITTKSYIIDSLKNLGAKKVIFTYQSYEDSFHFPRKLSELDIENLGGDVGFIGAWEKERCDSITYLVNHGINVTVYGGGIWKDYENYHPNLLIKPAVFSEDYSKALQSFKISLCFLRKINHDLHTSRTMEIPACGGFMVAERTSEHLQLFEENREAVYFSSNEELLEKCRYYLLCPEERLTISKAGTTRCRISGYSNKDTINHILTKINENGQC